MNSLFRKGGWIVGSLVFWIVASYWSLIGGEKRIPPLVWAGVWVILAWYHLPTAMIWLGGYILSLGSNSTLERWTTPNKLSLIHK